MKKNNRPIYKLCLTAMMMAISIVIGILCKNYLTWSVYNRVTFENLPIIFVGFCFGPVYGAAAGAGADVVSCLCSANPSVNPIITLGALTVGLLAGLMPKIFRKVKPGLSLAFSVAAAHLFGQVIIKSIGKMVYYDMPYVFAFMALGISCGVGAVEYCVIRLILRNPAVKKQLRELSDHDV